MWDSLVERVQEFFFNMLVSAINSLLGTTANIFEKSIDNVQSGIVETPEQFSPTLVEALRLISETAVMPVAGIILTYVFCYEIYILLTERNRGNEFDTGQVFFLIFKAAVIILLISNSFDLTLAFFDLSQWMINQIPVGSLSVTDIFQTGITDGLEEGEIGTALTLLIVALIAMVFAFFIAGIIYLVAWSRMITIMLYISISPLPFATLMNRDWVGSIGQNYLKQLVALMLQGFFMIICLVVYAGLIEKVSVLIIDEGATVYGILLMLVSMGVLALMLTRTHTLAKSVLGVI
ncbi:CD0415/CD1112 family protein [Oceanobacillus caeni]|uniref:VirB6/TrbL-like conjugal transfer protein, CD1112 family n=1 Tax=Oceanobacillus caeni TaxID=405946 RepID=UPI002149EFB5|nr:CD0415/CD1112 family protein [Oceanobacillus caeni]MCR1835573.1 CD0415/CD1112 family protein [Oceanobacillus caeni]